jgi:hypothetical protein
VTEYNHPAPSDYRAECMPMVGAFAALQDWDGIFEFDYGDTPTDWSAAKINNYFSMVTDPAKVAWFPIAANLLRREDMRPAQGETRLQVPRPQVAELLVQYKGDLWGLWKKMGVDRKDALVKRMAVQFTEGKQVGAPHLAAPEQACRELSWQADEGHPDVFSVDTAKTKVILGHIAGSTVKVGDLRFTVGPTSDGWVAVGLTSMDNLPLAQSRRMLLVAMSKVENQNMGWSADRRTVGNKWGNGPTIIENVTVGVATPGRKLQAWALDGNGKRAAPADAEKLNAGTVWYELTAP